MAEKELCFVGEFEMINKRNDMGIDLENIDWYLTDSVMLTLKYIGYRNIKQNYIITTHNFF